MSLVIAACGVAAGPAATTIDDASRSPFPSTVARVTPTPSPASRTPDPTRRPTASPRPASTPIPVPAQPTGVRFSETYESDYCPTPNPATGDPELCSIDERVITVSWKAPRRSGVTIRVYGITQCFGTDDAGTVIDGLCLRRRTSLPASVRVLLAKAPATKGTVTMRMTPSQFLAETANGVPVYSIVLAAYDDAGRHSIFTIARTIEYCQAAEIDCDP